MAHKMHAKIELLTIELQKQEKRKIDGNFSCIRVHKNQFRLFIDFFLHFYVGLKFPANRDVA